MLFMEASARSLEVLDLKIVLNEIFFNKVARFMPATLLKNIFHIYFSKILTRGSEEQHFRIRLTKRLNKL